MILTLKWLKEFLHTNAEIEIIEATLTSIGLEVESIIDRRKELSTFFVGKILSIAPHPSADRLQICQVQIGHDQILQIICGAQNARAGISVVVATIGSLIKSSSIVIQEAEIRGVKSYGMLCSRAELSLSSAILPKQGNSGILEMPDDAQIGDNLTKYFDLDDVIITCNVTPNRGDCLSVYGIARELAAAGIGTFLPAKIPNLSIEQVKAPNPVSVLTPHECPLFSLWNLENIKQVQTPDWISYRLENVGIKCIHPVVDILNYVSHSFGQPMHAYDSSSLKGAITVSNLEEGSSIVALDENQYQLSDKDIVVRSGNEILSIAGIIGSKNSKIASDTSKITIESAIFEPTSIASTGRKLRLQTDARYKFERNVDSEFCLQAVKIAIQMCLEICAGKLVSSVIVDNKKHAAEAIVFYPNHIKNFVGVEINENNALEILKNLGFMAVKVSSSSYNITPPSWRLDIQNENDLISEILRIHGYDKIPLIELSAQHIKRAPDKGEILRTILVQLGYMEAITWSFVNKHTDQEFSSSENTDSIEIENPISEDLAYMRQSIIPNLLQIVKKGQARSVTSSSLFEIGPVFWGTSPLDEKETLAILKSGLESEINPHNKIQESDIFDLKGDIEYLLKCLNIDVRKLSYIEDYIPKYCHPKKCVAIVWEDSILGYIGELHPKFNKELKFKTLISEIYLEKLQIPNQFVAKPYYCPSSYQSVKRDLSFLIDKEFRLGPIIAAIYNLRKDIIKTVNLFDIFEDENLPKGKKSFAITYVLQEDSRTLTDAEIKQVQEQIIALMHEKFNANLRI
jgi:phenylalanyl-tRNA synthetase beta chain